MRQGARAVRPLPAQLLEPPLPARQLGQLCLRRLSAAPDGLSCNYGADGVEVTLKLVQLVNGGAARLMNCD